MRIEVLFDEVECHGLGDDLVVVGVLGCGWQVHEDERSGSSAVVKEG